MRKWQRERKKRKGEREKRKTQNKKGDEEGKRRWRHSSIVWRRESRKCALSVSCPPPPCAGYATGTESKDRSRLVVFSLHVVGCWIYSHQGPKAHQSVDKQFDLLTPVTSPTEPPSRRSNSRALRMQRGETGLNPQAGRERRAFKSENRERET